MDEVRTAHLDDLGAERCKELDRLGEARLDTRGVASLPSSVTTPIRSPLTSALRAADTTSGTGALMDVESAGSWPAITWCNGAASSTVRAHGPGWSSEDAIAITPYRENFPP